MAHNQEWHHVRCGRQKFSSFRLQAPRSFFLSGSKTHYAPDLKLRQTAIEFDLTVLPEKKRLDGRVRLQFVIVDGDIPYFDLDQVDLHIQTVRNAQKKNLKFETIERKLRVYFEPNNPGRGQSYEIEIEYSVVNPRKGLYFFNPTSETPDLAVQMWSQGQDEDNRYWFPCLDYPNQKLSMKMNAKVPTPYMALSNGACVEKSEKGEWNYFRYELSSPLTTYLITLVVGDFSKLEDQGPRQLPVEYFVKKGFESHAKRTFGRTPAMIKVFEEKTGIPFPFEKYAQVAVQNFIFGGMENASATTQMDEVLLDEKASLDTTADWLVSHELAHQWFGDLVTCRDWSHAWLNEGFATFMERVWLENDPSQFGGLDEAKYYSYADFRAHQQEDQGQYRRPIVCAQYLEPSDLFDTHLYQKGGLVLTLLRNELGEEDFWASIHHYLKNFAHTHVETLDLIRSIEVTTGRNVRKLFDQWVFQAGYPEIEASYQFDEQTMVAEVIIEQKQTRGLQELKENDVITPIFELNTELEFHFKNGEMVREKIKLSSLKDRFLIKVPQKPQWLRLDPKNAIPKTLKFPRPDELLWAQLKNDLDAMGRIEAVQELGRKNNPKTVQQLGEVLRSEKFWGVQAEIAKVLGALRTDQAKEELEKSLGVKNLRGLARIVKALGDYPSATVIEKLKKVIAESQSYFVEAEALFALRRSMLTPGIKPDAANVTTLKAILLSSLKKKSQYNIIEREALTGLAHLPGLEIGLHSDVIDVLAQHTQACHTELVRVTAMKGIVDIFARSQESVRTKLTPILEALSQQDSCRLNIMLAQEIPRTGAWEGMQWLDHLSRVSPHGRVKRAVEEGRLALLDQLKKPESISVVQGELEKLKTEVQSLKSKLDPTRAAKPIKREPKKKARARR